jgi:hypothetical protein
MGGVGGRGGGVEELGWQPQHVYIACPLPPFCCRSQFNPPELTSPAAPAPPSSSPRTDPTSPAGAKPTHSKMPLRGTVAAAGCWAGRQHQRCSRGAGAPGGRPHKNDAGRPELLPGSCLGGALPVPGGRCGCAGLLTGHQGAGAVVDQDGQLPGNCRLDAQQVAGRDPVLGRGAHELQRACRWHGGCSSGGGTAARCSCGRAGGCWRPQHATAPRPRTHHALTLSGAFHCASASVPPASPAATSASACITPAVAGGRASQEGGGGLRGPSTCCWQLPADPESAPQSVLQPSCRRHPGKHVWRRPGWCRRAHLQLRHAVTDAGVGH